MTEKGHIVKVLEVRRLPFLSFFLLFFLFLFLFFFSEIHGEMRRRKLSAFGYVLLLSVGCSARLVTGPPLLPCLCFLRGEVRFSMGGRRRLRLPQKVHQRVVFPTPPY